MDVKLTVNMCPGLGLCNGSDTARTFEAGLAWFCAHVKEQVQVQLQESTDDDRTSQLSDVMVVCDEWSKDLRQQQNTYSV